MPIKLKKHQRIELMKKTVFLLLFLLLVYGACAKKQPTPVVSNAVLLAGDSIMAGMGPEIENQLRGRTASRFLQKGKVSSGLCRPDFYDWPSKLERFMLSYHPSLVLFCIGTNDTQPISASYGRLPFLSEEWRREYEERVESLILISRRYGADIVFVSPPVMGRKKLYADVPRINSIIRTVCRRNNVMFVDLWYLLADRSGRFQQYVDIDGMKVAIRAKDGVHVRREGNRILAGNVIQHLERASLIQ